VTGVELDLWWRRLLSAGLVGTARRPPPSVADLELAGSPLVAGPRPDARPEETALDAAAVGGALRRAGRLPDTVAADVSAAHAERLPEAPPRAGQLLGVLLHQPPAGTAGTAELLRHWYATCADTGYRLPSALLPVVLDRASAELRGAVARVAGERGAWLAGQNPDWAWLLEPPPADRTGPQAAAPGPVDPAEWALLGTDERRSVLQRVRERDPAAGRDLLLSAWPSESAKGRRALLEAMLVNVEPEDEDLLEGALDDRSAPVRRLAAEALDALPTSRRAARMAERLRPLVSETGLLRRHLEVRLPDDPDAAGVRDGLGKPRAPYSARGWWLERIVAGAPFEVWGAPAEQVVPRLTERHVLIGLCQAAFVRRSPEWARALLDLDVGSRTDGLGRMPALLGVLPRTEREDRVGEALGRSQPAQWPGILEHLPGVWSPRLSVDVVELLATCDRERVALAVELLMPSLVRGLHVDAAPELQRWRAGADLPRRLDDQLGSLVQTHTLRDTISEAFRR